MNRGAFSDASAGLVGGAFGLVGLAVVLLNMAGSIVGMVWLLIVGQWVLVVIGFALAFYIPSLYPKLLAHSYTLAVPALQRRGLGAWMPVIVAGLYSTLLAVTWVGVVWYVYVRNGGSAPKVPVVLTAYGVTLSPISILSRREGKDGHDFTAPGMLAQVAGIALGVEFLCGASRTVMIWSLGGIGVVVWAMEALRFMFAVQDERVRRDELERMSAWGEADVVGVEDGEPDANP